MKKQIRFLFDNYSCSMHRDFYEVTKELEPNDSIRQAGLAVAKEAAEKGLVAYASEISNEHALAIYISSKKITDAEKGSKESGFGIKYSILDDGSIRVLSNYGPLQYDWHLSEIEELIAEGYVKGDASQFIVALPTGIGAAPQDFFDWLGFMANTLQVVGSVKASGIASQKITEFIRDYQYRKISKKWQENGIRYPDQLREFIDTKGEWRLGEIKRRLRLNEEYAIKLLTALGFEPVNNTWRLTQSKESIANRKQWVKNEKKYRKTTEIVE